MPGSPGADDNASGVAALLECARVLSTARLNRDVQFVAFDMEEVQPEGMALVGSTAFVEAGDQGNAYEGLYNLEMIGYTSGTQGYPPGFQLFFPDIYERLRQNDFRGDFIAIVARGPGVGLARRFEEAAAKWVPGLEVLVIVFGPKMPMLPDIFRSDHAPFWAAGIPAVMFTDTANFRNPHYHMPTDKQDTLDHTFMADVTRGLAATLAQHAEVLPTI